MARPAQVTLETLRPPIRSRGPISATELGALLRVNRTTIARSLPEFATMAGEALDVVRLLRRHVG